MPQRATQPLPSPVEALIQTWRNGSPTTATSPSSCSCWRNPACIPFPSEVTMLVGGWYAAEGPLDFCWVGVAGVLGNLVGFVAGLRLGRWHGPRASRPLRQVRADPAPRRRQGRGVVGQAWRSGDLLQPAAPGDPHLHLGAGRHREDAVRKVHPLHVPGVIPGRSHSRGWAWSSETTGSRSSITSTSRR